MPETTGLDKTFHLIMKEMERKGEPQEMPFDIKRMVYGGFKVLVEG